MLMQGRESREMGGGRPRGRRIEHEIVCGRADARAEVTSSLTDEGAICLLTRPVCLLPQAGIRRSVEGLFISAIFRELGDLHPLFAIRYSPVLALISEIHENPHVRNCPTKISTKIVFHPQKSHFEGLICVCSPSAWQFQIPIKRKDRETARKIKFTMFCGY